MSDKEINPLKRGRLPNKSRGQRKSPAVGEISDPSSVLNDSISQGRVMSKKNDELVEKTTIVDDPLTDSENQATAKKTLRNDSNRRNEHRTRSEKPRRDSKSETSANELACACHKSMSAIKRWLRKIACYLGFKHECHKDRKPSSTNSRKPDNRYRHRGNNSRRPRSPQK